MERFSVQPHLRNRFDRLNRKLRFQGRTAEDALAWQARARRKLASLLGLNSMRRCPLQPLVTARWDRGDHICERVEIEVEPGLKMPAYVLVPKSGRQPFPTVICPHGHAGGGKAAVAGVQNEPLVGSAIRQYEYDYGLQFCRAGFLSLCPDARGFGERQESMARTDPLQSSCQWINRMALPLGQTILGMWVWDLKRLVDYATTRAECDLTRLACAGLSGGGLQTLVTAALDTRIRAAIVSGYFYGAKEALLDMPENCSCNYVPHLWEHVDVGDIGGLIAPRPLMIQTGDSDPLNGHRGLRNVRPQVALARRVYRALRGQGNLSHAVFRGGHRWHRGGTVRFLRGALGDSRGVRSRPRPMAGQRLERAQHGRHRPRE